MAQTPTSPGFVSIFDGKTLDGWVGAKHAYFVKDGAITCRTGSGGNLYTEKEYTDFVFRFELLRMGLQVIKLELGVA